MNSYTIISPIDENDFFERWDCSEKSNPNADENSRDRLKKFRKKKIVVSWIELNEMDSFNRIVLPHHASSSHFFKTSNGGSSMKDFLDKYDFDQLDEDSSDDCINRLNFQIHCYKNRIKYNPSYYEGFFMYITPNADHDLGQIDRNGVYLYAGNFHQFASIGLLIKKDGFKPLRLFLCENTT